MHILGSIIRSYTITWRCRNITQSSYGESYQRLQLALELLKLLHDDHAAQQGRRIVVSRLSTNISPGDASIGDHVVQHSNRVAPTLASSQKLRPGDEAACGPSDPASASADLEAGLSIVPPPPTAETPTRSSNLISNKKFWFVVLVVLLSIAIFVGIAFWSG